MKNLLFVFFVLFLFGCDKTKDDDSEKYFDYGQIKNLKIKDMDGYWDHGIEIDTSYYMGASFDTHPGFINGMRLHSRNGKAIWVSVFQSQEDAVEAMEIRINTVSCLIQNGASDAIPGKWWYMDCVSYAVFANKWNTIVQVDFSSNGTFDIVEDVLYNTANEVMDRIGKLGD